MQLLHKLFSSDFLPHGTCYLWNPQIVWLHVISDAVITASYYCIPLVLLYLVKKRRDIPFNWILWMCAAFILGCGTTHLMEVWTIWHPSYLLAGIIKALTAAVSVVTAVFLLRLLPKALSLPPVDQLYGINRNLEDQLNIRARREQELTQLIAKLEAQVTDRTRELESINTLLQKEIAIGVEAPLKRWAVAGTVVALLASGFMGSLCWRAVAKASNDASWVAHTQEVRNALQTTLRHVDDIESGTRAFEARGEDRFLKPYEEARLSIANDLKSIRRLVSDNRSQENNLARLESQVNAKVEFSQRMIAARRKTGALATSAAFLESDRLMEEVRATVALMDIVERELLDERSRETQEAQRRIKSIVVLGALASAIFLLIAGSIVRREVNRSSLLSAQLRRLNTDLEQRVEQRTAALQESEARLGGIIESAMDAILTIDDGQRILLFNRAAERMFGYDAKRVIGQPLDRFIPERFRAAHVQHIRRFSSTGVTNRTMGAMGELWGLRSDGSEFPIEASISQTETTGRKLFTVILRDVTERKRAEAAVRRSQAQLTGIIQSATDAILTVDSEQNVVLFNTAAEKMFGCSAQEALGKPIECFIPQRFRFDHRTHIRRFGETGVTSRIMGRLSPLAALRTNGEEFPIEASISQIETDGKKLFTVIIRDITERKRIEEALRMSEERFRLLLDGVKDYAIYMLDLEGRVMSWNAGAARMKGYSSEEIIGKNFSCFYTHEAQKNGKPLKELQEAMASGRFEEEGLRVRKDGTSFWAYIVITPLYDDTGALRGFSKVARDITERRKAEEEIRKLNQELEQRVEARTAELQATNKELEAFTYSVSHDLRAPLRHIAGFSKMLAEETENSLAPEGRHYLQRIQDGIRRMGNLVDDLLSLTRIGRHELRPQVTGLDSIVRDVLDELKPDTEKREIEWKIGSLPYVEGDPSLLRVVFQNLLSNAIKYTRPRSKAIIEVGTEIISGEYVVYVRDNGVGFNTKYADKLFGVFQRHHRAEDFEGTGVGLATVQRIIQKHGGRIWADAELDKGATFYLTLGGSKQREHQKEPVMAGDTV